MIVATLTYALMVFGTGLQEPQDLRIQWLCAARRFPKAGSVIYLKPPEKEQEHEKTTQTRNGDDLQHLPSKPKSRNTVLKAWVLIPTPLPSLHRCGASLS